LELDAKVDPRRTAVLVIDMQNDFCMPAAAYARAVPEVGFEAWLKHAERGRGMYVDIPLCREDSWGAQIIADIVEAWRQPGAEHTPGAVLPTGAPA
jgi:nicotinamidase-related amidase